MPTRRGSWVASLAPPTPIEAQFLTTQQVVGTGSTTLMLNPFSNFLEAAPGIEIWQIKGPPRASLLNTSTPSPARP